MSPDGGAAVGTCLLAAQTGSVYEAVGHMKGTLTFECDWINMSFDLFGVCIDVRVVARYRKCPYKHFGLDGS